MHSIFSRSVSYCTFVLLLLRGCPQSSALTPICQQRKCLCGSVANCLLNSKRNGRYTIRYAITCQWRNLELGGPWAKMQGHPSKDPFPIQLSPYLSSFAHPAHPIATPLLLARGSRRLFTAYRGSTVIVLETCVLSRDVSRLVFQSLVFWLFLVPN